MLPTEREPFEYPSVPEAGAKHQRSTQAAPQMPTRPTMQTCERFFQLAPDLLCIAGFDGTFQHINLAWKQTLGFSPPALIAKPIIAFVHPEDRDETKAMLETLLCCNHALTFTNRCRCSDGRYRWFEWHATPLPDEQLFYAIVRDVTERKTSEESWHTCMLEEFRAQTTELQIFSALAEQTPDGIAIATLDGSLSYINAAYDQMMGYGQAVRDLTIFDLTVEPHERIQGILEHVLSSGAWQGLLTYRRKDGTTFPGLLSAFIARNQHGEPLAAIGVVRDMHEPLCAEEERIALQQQVIEAQRAALRDVSTPVIPLNDEVLVMPLIASIDSHRAQQIIETLLQGVEQRRAKIVILDITGVPVVDIQVADALVRAAQAVRLLGAEVVITGIRPTIALTLIHLGVSLHGITTCSSLQAGISYAVGCL